MPMNIKSPYAMKHIKDLMEQAMSAPNGIRITCKTEGAARHLRQQCYTVRKSDRSVNMKMYNPEDPLYGASVWDELVFKLGEGEEACCLFIECSEAALSGFEVEEL